MYKIKKMLSVVLALVMTFSMFAGICFTANADDTENVKFTVVNDGSIPTVGEKFNITIYIENAKNLLETEVDIAFNSNALNLLYVSKPKDLLHLVVVGYTLRRCQ